MIQALRFYGPRKISLFLLGYYGIGMALLGGLKPADVSWLFQAISLTVLLPCLLLFLLVGQLLPEREATTSLKTKTWRRFETRLNIGLASLVAFFCSAPILVAMTSSNPGLSIAHIAPVLTWALIIKTFGWSSLRSGLALPFCSSSLSADITHADEDIHRFLIGLAIARGRAGKTNWRARLIIARSHATPFIEGEIEESMVTPKADPIPFSEIEALALMRLITGDGNPYKLPLHMTNIYPLIFPELSAHEKLGLVQEYRSIMEATEKDIG